MHEDHSIIKGQKPSQEDMFYIEWGKVTLKENISALNDAFRLFITLDTALLSAYLGFYDEIKVHPPWLKMLPATLAVLSLLSSIVGIYPASVGVDLRIPEEIKTYKIRRARFKGRCLLIASAALVCGFITFLVARWFTQ